MRQRVMIAIAVSCEPRLLIADEPTTALDVTIQAQILDLLRNLKNKINSSIMLITHDLGVIAEMADYVVVMYAGRVVEKGTVEEIFANPAHPYTIGLFTSKYGERVKVYTMGDFSKEICGGPHASNTGDLKSFKIKKEERSSAGVRRIKAVISNKE